MCVCVCVCLSVCLSLCVGEGGLSVSVCLCLSVRVSVWVGGCVGVVSVKIKRPALPPCAVNGRSRNPICFNFIIIIIIFTVIRCRFPKPPVD